MIFPEIIEKENKTKYGKVQKKYFCYNIPDFDGTLNGKGFVTESALIQSYNNFTKNKENLLKIKNIIDADSSLDQVFSSFFKHFKNFKKPIQSLYDDLEGNTLLISKIQKIETLWPMIINYYKYNKPYRSNK